MEGRHGDDIDMHIRSAGGGEADGEAGRSIREEDACLVEYEAGGCGWDGLCRRCMFPADGGWIGLGTFDIGRFGGGCGQAQREGGEEGGGEEEAVHRGGMCPRSAEVPITNAARRVYPGGSLGHWNPRASGTAPERRRPYSV